MIALEPIHLRHRAYALSAVRGFFEQRGYIEIQSPVRVVSPALEEQLFGLSAEGQWLRTSPEFALKKALAQGLHRIFEIGPCFRGRESGPWHGTEFTMLEWYRAGAELPDLMEEVKQLFSIVATSLGVPSPADWQRRSIHSLFLEHTGLDLAHASASELSIRDVDSWDAAFFRRWIEDIEPQLVSPTFVEAWPASQAALAALRTDGDFPVAERFEVFLNGIELGNAFQELLSGDVLRHRFEHSAAMRIAAGEDPHPIDEDLIHAVDCMPKTAGIAIGFDRLLAILSGWSGISPGRFPETKLTTTFGS